MSIDASNINSNNSSPEEHIFLVPENYFEGLHDQILKRVFEEKQINILDSPKLKENVFKVPASYFDNANAIIENANKPEIKVIPLYNRNWVRYMAASIALVLVFVFGINSNNSSANDLASISDTEIIEYLFDEGINSLDILADLDVENSIFNDFIEDGMAEVDYMEFDSPEMDYDFEYFDY